jgi:hypothetical protein
VQGWVYKGCTCPVRRDARGRKVACGKAHGSWSYNVDAPAVGGGSAPADDQRRLPHQEGRRGCAGRVAPLAGRWRCRGA